MRWRELFIPSADRRFAALLDRQAEVAGRACALLAAGGAATEMAALEAEGDEARRALSQALARTYATPFDRDDIFTLSSALDDVVDSAQDAVLTIAIFAGWGEYAHLQEMARSLQEGAIALRQAVTALPAARAQEPARRSKRSENVVASLCRYGMDLAFRTRETQEALRLREALWAVREVGRALGAAADITADIAVKER